MAKDKKAVKKDAKKITRIICFILLTLALLVGIVFSSVKVNMDMIYGPEYNGAYQASVQVLKNNKAVNEEGTDSVDMDTVAGSLQDKLAPFSNKSINVSIQGKNHVNVLVGKQEYESNESYLRNQIQSNGGLYMLSETTNKDNNSISYSDFAIASDTRYTSSDLFDGSVRTKSLSDGTGRKPFVEMGLNSNGDFVKLLESANSNKQQSNVVNFDDAKKYVSPKLLFVSNLEEMVDTLRYLYLVDDKESTVETYYNQIIKPMQDYINGNGPTSEEKSVLEDLFGGKVSWKENGSAITQTKKVSLLEKSFTHGPSTLPVKLPNGQEIDGINSLDDLKNILGIFTPNTSERPTSSFIYSANASNEDVNKKEYKNWLNGSSSPIDATNKDVFSYVINSLIGKTLLDHDAKEDSFTPSLQTKLTNIVPDLKNDFLYDGTVVSSTSGIGTTNIAGAVDGQSGSFVVDNAGTMNTADSSGVRNAFYLRTKNLTSATQAVASIQQNALGITYLVESITNVNPYITSALYITSIVVLSFIALLLAVYVLFVYRLLGLFTIIVAACSIAIMLLAAVGFGIAFGPQTLAAGFVILALILDVNFILFEGFKDNYYKNKHGIMSSFRIGNRETLAMAVDAVVVAFIPNLVLFWAGSGPVKSFGTMAIVGVALAIVCGIIISRFIYWLLLQSKIVQRNEWLLPIDTSYTSFQTMRDEYLINKYNHYLESNEGKDKYTSKELAKISRYKKLLEAAKKQYHAHLLENNSKVAAKDEKTIERIKKNTAFLTRIKNWFIKTFKIKKPIYHPTVRLLDAQIDDNNVITDLENKSEANDKSNKIDSKLQDKGRVIRKNRFIGRGTMWFIVALVVVLIVSAIVGGVLGANWSTSVGYGQQYIVYGDAITRIQDNFIGSDGNDNAGGHITDKALINKIKEIKQNYAKSIDEINHPEKPEIDPDGKNKQAQLNEIYAYEIRDLLSYAADEDKFAELGSENKLNSINLKSINFEVVDNYEHVNSSNVPSNKDFIALRINSSSVDKKSRTMFKRLLLHMYQPSYTVLSNPDDFTWPSDAASNGWIEAYDLAPYTINFQVKEIAVALGITLAVLIVYILIRFKWTYYVALALGLALTAGIVVALVVIFRVPVSVDLLCGMSFVLTFAITTMILVLGKGRSQLNLEEKENISKNFSGEIKIAASIRAKKAETKAVCEPLVMQIKKIKKSIKDIKKKIKQTLSGYDELSSLEQQLVETKEKLSLAKKEQNDIYKAFKDKAKQEQNEEQRKNWYFKKLFSDLINYSAWRMLTLGVFYLLVGIVLAATLPSIVGLGITLVFGILAGFAVALFITVPVWIFFEKRRIRYVYGRRSYIESLKVSQEEEIISGIND